MKFSTLLVLVCLCDFHIYIYFTRLNRYNYQVSKSPELAVRLHVMTTRMNLGTKLRFM